jgi:large subunit ribosomal protein L18
MDARKKRAGRRSRQLRIRKKIRGSATTPRLSVFRSNAHIYAQLIDDAAGNTIAAASSREAVVTPGDGGKIAIAKQVGELIGQRGTAAGVTECVFDRGGNRYAGRVAALADGAREAGLKF